MDAYLKQRVDGKSNAFYVQYPVPRDVQSLLGKRYERRSCGTENRNDARRIAATLVAAWERQYQRLRLEAAASAPTQTHALPTTLSDALIEQICERWYGSALTSDDAERDDGIVSEELDDIEKYLQARGADARLVATQGKAAPSYPIIESEAIEFAESIGFSLNLADSLMPNLVKKFAATQLRTAQELSSRNSGNFVGSPVVPPKFSGPTILEYMSEWERLHVQGLKPNTIGAYKSRITQFQEFLIKTHPDLKDASFRAVEPRHVQAFANHLMHVECLNPKTIRDGYLAALASICKYAVADGHLDQNPTETTVLSTLPKKVLKQRNRPRHPFSIEFVNTLFSSDWYLKNKPIGSSPILKDWSVRYWFPLISLCHGFRPSEISRMLLTDVFHDGDTLAFRVRDGKTEATNRSVSVHQKLIDLGFDKWIKERKKNNGELLFNVFGRYQRNDDVFTQRFDYYIRNKLCAPPTYTTYSFRHLWEDMRRATIARYGSDAWPKGMSFQLSGREDIEKEEGSASTYGKGYDAKTMKPYLDSVWHPDIQLPVPYVS